jgi:hypothetical protein
MSPHYRFVSTVFNQLHWVFVEKLTVVHLIKKLPAFWKLITRWIKSIPSNPIYLRFILILFSHLCLGFPSGFFPSDFLTNTLYALLSYACYMPYPYHHPWFHHPNFLWYELWIMVFLVMQFSPTRVTFSLLSPNVLLRTLFSNTLSLCPALNVVVYKIYMIMSLKLSKDLIMPSC